MTKYLCLIVFLIIAKPLLAQTVNHRVLVLGPKGVGKTSILGSLEKGRGVSDTPMLTTDYRCIYKTFSTQYQTSEMQICDTPGLKDFNKINERFYVESDAFVLVYNPSEEKSKVAAINLKVEILNIFKDLNRKELPLFLFLGNRVEEKINYEIENGGINSAFLVDPKTGVNILESFSQLASELDERSIEPANKSQQNDWSDDFTRYILQIASLTQLGESTSNTYSIWVSGTKLFKWDNLIDTPPFL